MISQILIGAVGVALGTLSIKLPGIGYRYIRRRHRQWRYKQSVQNRRMGYTCDPWDRD